MARHFALLVVLGTAFSAVAGAPQPDPTDWHHTRPPPAKGFTYPECYCTDSRGQRVEIGQTSCLQIGPEQVLAQCGMSLNNPIWRRLDKACPNV